MMNKTNQECETKRCLYDSATRTRFYNGMLLTEEHLRTEQEYHREALKRVNRHLFGSGIVCGLEVQRQERGLCIKVQPGVALDCCGNMIEVCNCITIDLSKECKDKYGADCITPSTENPEQFVITKYLVLQYKETFSDPEPVLTTPDDCKPAGEKPNCEASKIREGFCIELWDECPCPEKHEEPEQSLLATLQAIRDRNRPQAKPKEALPREDQVAANRSRAGMQATLSETKPCIELPLPCSSCGCCENTNAVGLGAIRINCADSTLEVVECTCRRYVMSPRLMNWVFSRLQSRNYMTDEVKDVYELMDLTTAHLVATHVTFEANSEMIRRHEREIQELRAQLNRGPEGTPGETAPASRAASKRASKKPGALAATPEPSETPPTPSTPTT